MSIILFYSFQLISKQIVETKEEYWATSKMISDDVRKVVQKINAFIKNHKNAVIKNPQVLNAASENANIISMSDVVTRMIADSHLLTSSNPSAICMNDFGITIEK